MKPFAPKRFGAYWLVEHLGEGGMGDVYLARREGLAGADRLCVIKTIRAELAHDTEHLTRFLDEARVATRLNHRNICTVFDVGRVGDETFLAMDVVNGVDAGTLFRRMQERRRPLPPAVALYLACETLDALDYAHRLTDPVTGKSLQIVHRDVSPHNVMVTFEGEVKLIDFGLARSSMRDAGEEHTGKHVVVGKLKYMAPEQARGAVVDARADQFSTAVMLTELLTGERFFEGVDEHQVTALVLWATHRPAGFASLDAALKAVLSRALSADPTKRYASCRDMLEALDELPARRDPGASRALRTILDAELDDEKRALRARLALGSGRLGSMDIDPSARTVVKAVPGFGVADAPTRVQSDDLDSPTEVFHQDDLLPTDNSATERAMALLAGFPANVGDAVTEKLVIVRPQAATEPALRAPVPPPKPAPAPAKEPSSSSSAVTGSVVGHLPEAPRRSPRFAALAVVGVVVLVATVLGRLLLAHDPVAVAATDAGPVLAVDPLEPVHTEPAHVEPPAPPAHVEPPTPPTHVEPAHVEPAHAPPPQHVERVPRPPKSGNLKDTLDYLEKNCRKRVKCAQPLVDKRGALATMPATDIMHIVEDADACARKCAKP